MTALLCVPVLVESPEHVEDHLHDVGVAAELGATAVEWRVDPLADPSNPLAASAGVQAVARLLADAPLPTILTCRGADEGGAAEIDDEDRADFLERLADRADAPRPTWIDVEHAAWVRSDRLRAVVSRFLAPRDADERSSRLILSAHDFGGRPGDLWQRIEAMSAIEACAVVKIAWTARSLRDTAEIAEVLAHRSKPTIALGMGPFGTPSRVLAARLGGMLTFATLGDGRSTAPGQPTIAALVRTLRFRSIGRATRVYGVIGMPIEHSRGPQLHNAGFEAIGFDGTYLPLPVDEGWESFKATLATWLDEPRLGFAGASVTIPHKEHLLRFVAESGGRVEPAAARCGAANTLVVDEDGGLVADNTDAPAIVDSVRAAGVDPVGCRVLVLGAGGAARAAAAGLAAAGARVRILARTPARAQSIAEGLDGAAGDGDVLAMDVKVVEADASPTAEGIDLVFNATPVGMATGEDPGGDPLPATVELGARHTVFDSVYAPLETPLVARARSARARVITGDAMFIGQAARQFEAWTGRALPDAAIAALHGTG